MKDMHAAELLGPLTRVGLTSVEPSNIQGSPYDYLYVFLSDDKFDGPYIIISDAREHGDSGYVVGMYPSHKAMEDGRGDNTPAGSVEEVLHEARLYAGEVKARQKRLKAFTRVLEKFKRSAEDVLALWPEDADVEGYPEYMPSFDEFCVNLLDLKVKP